MSNSTSGGISRRITSQMIGEYVSPHHIGIVLYDGYPHHLVGPGRFKPRSWWESLGPQINIRELRSQVCPIDNVRSQNGFLFQANVTIQFQFEPRMMKPKMAVDFAYKVANSPLELSKLVGMLCDNAVRFVAGEWTAKELIDGRRHSLLRGNILRRIQQAGRRYGVRALTLACDMNLYPIYEKVMQATLLSPEERTLLLNLELLEAMKQGNIQLSHFSTDANILAALQKMLPTSSPLHTIHTLPFN